jgi:hypothetical protein
MLYSLYPISDAGKRLAPVGIEAEDDQHALKAAVAWLRPDEIGEIWLRGTRVGKVMGLPRTS